uniref:AAA+ ATPase domain-containing protein n=1 Tax=Candidatus Kentrum sp. FW TaxID=2126338 RepID=A0A450U1G9_9GAMM|nr:MAG: hypothetical protein BECKFW1821B_GA0114236_102315 [Candidatus Kentron sp. FW]VFJ76112.1 MAG: hypothetical protein BECKFW1821C_GA0114237_10996 [Candidatus Kentron sp. FW]
MSLDLTFKNICTTIKKQGKGDPELLEAVDNLLGFALVCSPVVLGPAAAAWLPILVAKNELTKIGKSVFEKFTKNEVDDYSLRHETMRTAYGLLVFTSFFDTLDSRLPKALRKEIRSLGTEKASLALEAIAKSTSEQSATITTNPLDAPISTYSFPFPHPTETLDEQCRRQEKLWNQMKQGFVEFVQKLPFWEEADRKKQKTLLSGMEKIEGEVAKRFEAQYFELARKFEDFAIWANLQAHKETKALIGDLSGYVRCHAALSAASEKAIDVGFEKLREAVQSIPELLRIEQADEIVGSLDKHYQARVNEPIIEDKDIGDEESPRLSFPKVRDAFVPQAFRVLRQTGKSRHLEDESTWRDLPRRNDLGAFFLSYLSSPYSTETPLLILGHPGSGKSLLTTVLSAQLLSRQFVAVRVPLREVDADADIRTQIEDAIRRITGVSIDSWIKLSARFKNCPPLVILDGYDELLQASGQVFASYIKDAQRFQEQESEQGRPLRIIITSRITLIDKATVPAGSTIVRLLEFDRHQRERWSKIWNRTNANYFRSAGIEQFTLPEDKEKGADKILDLAKQPLLLLMLALYDSEKNQLRNSEGLDRAKLYDSLLRRFVIRERGKEKDFNDAAEKEREKALSTEMQRLGAAALGMYNRRKVHILSRELDDDLAFFKLERQTASKPGRALSQADLLLGSFFFVHKSKARHGSGPEETHEESAAFEFLHNTFGEFLTADFILRRAVSQVKKLRTAESSDEEPESMMDAILGTADGLDRHWFASLVYTPLFTRPVVMEMIREWAPHVIKDRQLSKEDFIETLGKIVLNQIKRILSKREMPRIMSGGMAQEGYRVPFGDHPLVGHIAIYSINLVLLRLVAGNTRFDFDEGEITSHEDGTRPWDRLTHIWRSWFSLGNLNGLTAVMLAERRGAKIEVTTKSKFQAQESKGKLHEFRNVALSLGDAVSAGIAGAYLFDPAKDSIDDLDGMFQRLNSEGYELGLPAYIVRLLTLAEHFPDSSDQFAKHGRETLEQAVRSGRRDQIEQVCRIISRTLEEMRDITFTSRAASPARVFHEILHPRLVFEVAMREPGSARTLVELGKRLGGFEWFDEFSDRFLHFGVREMRFHRLERNPMQMVNFLKLLQDVSAGIKGHRYPDRFIERELVPDLFEHMLHPRHLLELAERNPEGVLAYLQIAQEFGGRKYLERFIERELEPKFFERMPHPRHLLEVAGHNPERALSYLQIAKELGGRRDFGRFIEREMGPRFFEHMLHPRHLLEFAERNPEGALTYLQIVRELGGDKYIERFIERELEPEFFERMLHPRHLVKFNEYRMSSLSFWLAYARLSGSPRLIQALSDSISAGVRNRKELTRYLGNLPLAAFSDLRWLSEQIDNPDVQSVVSELVSPPTTSLRA